MDEENNKRTVLGEAAEFFAGAPIPFSPWWRDKKQLTDRLVELVRYGGRDIDDLILAAIVERVKTDRCFRQKLAWSVKRIRAGRRGNPETPASELVAIYLHVEGERNILKRSQKEAFESVGRIYCLSDSALEKRYWAGKKLYSPK